MATRFGRASLVENCRKITAHVLHKRYATEEEVAAYAPGGASNPNPKGAVGAWVYYYGQLCRFLGREETRQGDVETADAVVLDALRGAPQEVSLLGQLGEGVSDVVRVYPKGLDALLHLHGRDRKLHWLAERLHLLNQDSTPDDLELIGRVLGEMAFQYGVVVWIVTHPGSWMPWDPNETDRPTLPAWIQELQPFDVIRIAQAHSVVNASRVQAVEALLTTSDEDDDEATTMPSWSLFIGAMAIEQNVPPEALMRDRSLGALLASTKLKAGAERDARKASERKAASEAP